MTAGEEISHSEVAVDQVLHGAQLWRVLPSSHRFSPACVDRYRPEPVRIGKATALVFLGSLAGSTSPAVRMRPRKLAPPRAKIR